MTGEFVKLPSELAIIILAAGKGTRMKSYLPKVMHKIACKPLIKHVIDTAKILLPKNIVTVLASDMQYVEQLICFDSQISIQKQQLGTGHAVKVALEKLTNFHGNILILYGDTPFINSNTLKNLLAKISENNAVAVLGFNANEEAKYGRLITDGNDNLTEIVEYNDASNEQRKITLCNSGVFAIKSDVLKNLISKIDNKNKKGEYYLTDIISLSVKEGYRATYISCQEDEVLGINNKIELANAEKLMQKKLANHLMEQGVTLLDPASLYLSSDLKIGKDVIIEPNVFFGEDVRIGDNVHIKSFSHIEGAFIESGSIIGPFARLRPGSNIGQNVKIGNFVEIKKSNLSSGVKVNHLSYIGDSQVGEDANIGAGTITCNYDGFNKFETIIGRGVFVGSNCALVAPLMIKDGAMIAAGSVVTDTVSVDDLAIARNRQTNISGWAKIFRSRKKDK